MILAKFAILMMMVASILAEDESASYIIAIFTVAMALMYVGDCIRERETK